MKTGVNLVSAPISPNAPTPAKVEKSTAMSLFPRNTSVQFRNTNVGMFSGPRPSYGSYSVGQNAFGALNRTGA